MKTLHAFRFWANTRIRPCTICLSFFIFHSSFFTLCKAQNVAINSTGVTADPSAMLDVKSTTAGVLIPRMTTAQRNAISSPAVGLQIFNTDCDVLNYWTGTCWVSAGAIPAPDSISSSVSTALCVGATATYSIPAITGATAYYWSAPPGANITSGQGTTSITVTYGSYSGNVCVTANDACETSQPTCRQVNITAPATPGAITGVTSSCASAVNVAYSVPVVTGAISYNWSVPSGASIITGQGTNAITVNFGTTSGSISVYATNSCGNSSSQTLAVTLTGAVPATPGVITGAANVCKNVTSQNYSIFPVIGATSYTWSVPSGAVITSGQGTTGITVIYPTTTTSGQDISVYANNSCGTSVVSSQLLIIAYTAQAAPGLIGGSNVVAAGSSGNVYSIAPVTGAVGYKWTITPAGATIASGQGSTSITVTFTSTPATYAICVYDSGSTSGCNSPTSCLTVGSSACPLHGTLIFSYTGALQNWLVPCGISQVTAYLWGAGGASYNSTYNGAGGSGAFVGAVLNVSAATTLNIVVGQGAKYATSYTSGTYGGGGNNSASSTAGAGGGRSAIQFNGNNDDILTAGGGGGGGGGYATAYYGNGGGGGNGTNASNGNGSGQYSGEGGIGGTASGGGAGGTASCSSSYNGTAASSSQYNYQGGAVKAATQEGYYGGAGGGGYYGGGSGGGCGGGGGGGGSSYPTSAVSPVTSLIAGPVAGNTDLNGTNNNFIYPADYNVSPFNTYYITGVGISGTYNGSSFGNGGNGEVVIIY